KPAEAPKPVAKPVEAPKPVAKPTETSKPVAKPVEAPKSVAKPPGKAEEVPEPVAKVEEAVPAASAPKPPVSASSPPRAVAVEPSLLDGVELLADLSPEARARLASAATVEVLAADEEVSGFAAALLVEGEASVCATIVDERVSRAERGALVPTR